MTFKMKVLRFDMLHLLVRQPLVVPNLGVKRVTIDKDSSNLLSQCARTCRGTVVESDDVVACHVSSRAP